MPEDLCEHCDSKNINFLEWTNTHSVYEDCKKTTVF